MILVTGATGATGSALVRLLVGKKAPVRALARNPEKAKTRLGPGVDIVLGDFDRPESLDLAMRGIDRMFLLSSPGERAATLQGNAIDAAVRAGVRHIVKMSAVESVSNSPCRLLRVHAEIEHKLESSGIPYTNLRPHSFMQSTFAFAETIASQGKFYAPAAGEFPLVDVRDIAAVAAEVLTTPGHEGMTYTITGPEALTYTQVASKIGAAIGRPIQFVEVPSAAVREAMLAKGMSEWIVDGLIELFALYATGRASFITDVVETVGKKRPTMFDQFAAESAPRFAGQGVPAPAA
jgi:uncharacterized protein YbjT (DUF2867 family)